MIPRSVQIALRRRIIQHKLKSVSHIWPIDPSAAKKPAGFHGWPNNKKFALILTHDVDTKQGHDKCRQLMDLEESLGFRSSFNFVPEKYPVSENLRKDMTQRGFEVGVHGLNHDGKLFNSKKVFKQRAQKINHYLKNWNATGFSSPSMHRNLNWMHHLNITHSTSTFDTDPFEPMPDGVKTIFPFFVTNGLSPRMDRAEGASSTLGTLGTSNFRHSVPPAAGASSTSPLDTGQEGTYNLRHFRHSESPQGFLELPYTLPQDHTIFILLKEQTINIWKQKLNWIAENGGMALLNTHPDYMAFNGKESSGTYPSDYYIEFLEYIKSKYCDNYENILASHIAKFSDINWPKESKNKNRKKIWIDLDNSPHVPFFKPIIRELENSGYSVLLTARDCQQTCEMADTHQLPYRRIGRHHGKNKVIKLFGLFFRAFQLAPIILKEKPIIALSHGSRAQIILSKLLGIPSVLIQDYEHARLLPFFKPKWEMGPDILPDSAFHINKKCILKYPGIKEDVYLPYFKPDPNILTDLKIRNGNLLVIVRPPAVEAHYHCQESEPLFEAVMERLLSRNDIQVVVLPRYEKQKNEIKHTYEELILQRKVILPEHVVDGLNLMWHSDVVISGGGTMNREAAALGVPVYSIFRGPIGTVDKTLQEQGRLVLLESIDDVHHKIHLKKREWNLLSFENPSATLASIVRHISTITNHQ